MYRTGSMHTNQRGTRLLTQAEQIEEMKKIYQARQGISNANQQAEEEAEKKFNEICELLLTGGYFRARVSGIKPFDKVLGGLAWAISSSNMDVDLDLFQENANLGEKLKLGESIVSALVRMKCPYPLQTYQIKGLDYDHIFPVIQWLIKKVIETRMEFGDSLRRFSEGQFERLGGVLPEEQLKKFAVSDTIKEQFAKKFGPERRFKRSKSVKPTAQTTILEYTAKKDTIKSSEFGSFESSTGNETASVGNYIDFNDIKEASAQYQTVDEVAASGKNQSFFEERQLNNQIAQLNKEIAQSQSVYDSIQAKYDEANNYLQELEGKLRQIDERCNQINEESNKLDEMITPENAVQLEKLKSLVALNEALKKQEKEFKQTCKEHMRELKEAIEQKAQEASGKEEEERVAQINATFAKDSEKLKKLRALSAQKTRDIMLIQRRLDDVPSRAEQQQYQTMFVELYEQIAAKLIDTRRQFNTYNTMEDTRQILSKEVTILDSIFAQYKVSMKSKSTQQKFLSSLEDIKAEEVTRERRNHGAAVQRVQTLSQREREQARAAEEFEQACKKNDELEAEIARLEGEITQAKQDKILGIIREPPKETVSQQNDSVLDTPAQTEKQSPSTPTSTPAESQERTSKKESSGSDDSGSVAAVHTAVATQSAGGEEPKEKSKEKSDEKEKIDVSAQAAHTETQASEESTKNDDAADDFDPLADE